MIGPDASKNPFIYDCRKILDTFDKSNQLLISNIYYKNNRYYLFIVYEMVLNVYSYYNLVFNSFISAC